MRSKSLFAPVLLIVVGAALLLHKQGFLPDLGRVLEHWWPLALVVAGLTMLWRRTR